MQVIKFRPWPTADSGPGRLEKKKAKWANKCAWAVEDVVQLIVGQVNCRDPKSPFSLVPVCGILDVLISPDKLGDPVGSLKLSRQAGLNICGAI
jgi:hypothetical protein